ncbi:hypothetical protein GS504_02755 [Rhodococcus hoagii]|nr:hypothetical protein [Prescottella equi]NKS56507.1 hypothetical protein [Prescottella equi]NKS64840.1 hypothetical protein [Prescottella equi]NKZ93448.1 hypothetical protein [Prescottella equi]NKZ93499.1 hypothetical protein [Prescottella equi]
MSMSEPVRRRPHELHRPWRQWTRTAGGAVLVLMVAFYAPLAFTYFLNGPQDVRLQDHLLEFLVSPAFAFGLGSANDGHVETYVATYAVMWVHTVVGSVTLVTPGAPIYWAISLPRSPA